ncbi:MAG TPA: hypothetical protein VKB79_24780 [Bryobacteraceae bacterium]|nr:hypothetical protein [Bryobacteraceae bacterium]
MISATFAIRDVVLPDEKTEYAQTRAALMSELAPQGILEQTFAGEIMTATWRLRRCGLLEAALPINDDEDVENKQRSIDRARTQAHRILRQSMAELRALQTERCIRRDLDIAENIGLADSAKVLRACNEAPARNEEGSPEAESAPAQKPSRITLRDLENLMTLADKKLCAEASALSSRPSSATISS